jgi:hypothetical protein
MQLGKAAGTLEHCQADFGGQQPHPWGSSMPVSTSPQITHTLSNSGMPQQSNQNPTNHHLFTPMDESSAAYCSIHKSAHCSNHKSAHCNKNIYNPKP